MNATSRYQLLEVLPMILLNEEMLIYILAKLRATFAEYVNDTFATAEKKG